MLGITPREGVKPRRIRINPEPYRGITPTVPRDFLRKLKRIDRTLDCVFDRDVGKFVITQQGKISGNVPVLIVAGDVGGGYRYPDNRDIRQLQRADMHRVGYKEQMRRGEEHILSQKNREEAFVDDEIKHIARDNKRYLSEQFRRAQNDGKANASLRKVTSKPKGVVIDKRRVH